jgi:ankyrin repeat protein
MSVGFILFVALPFNIAMASSCASASEQQELNEELIEASKQDDATLINQLVAQRANVNAVFGINRYSALLSAAYYGRPQIINALINHAANVNQCDQQQYSPLYWASSCGHQSVVSTLIQHAANVNQGNATGITPLHEASRYGHQQVMDILIRNSANVNQCDQVDETPLHVASRRGLEAAVMHLIDNGADINIINVCTAFSFSTHTHTLSTKHTHMF